MVKMKSTPGMGGPSSSLGIMRFFDQDVGGPKVSPEFIIVISLALAIGVIILHAFS